MVQFLDEDEMNSLILSLAASRGDAGFTEEEAAEVVAWGERVRLEADLLELVLGGHVRVDFGPEGVMFAHLLPVSLDQQSQEH